MRLIIPRQRISTCHEALSLFIGLANTASRRIGRCTQCRHNSSASPTVNLLGKSYNKDSWYNIPATIQGALDRRLHVQPDHPIAITRSIIESKFPSPTYKYHNTFSPIVTTHQNFDSLGFPLDHPGRSKTDTYYVNEKTVLRTHTSAHQADVFRANESEGYLISADVYRRDAIDRSHYPVFHQMEGARMWDRNTVPEGDIAAAVWKDIAALPTHDMIIEDPNPPTHPLRNPLQRDHAREEAEAIAAHLKRSLELMVVDIFSRAKRASTTTDSAEPLRVRWIEAFFPFTSPSWELEIHWQGDWLEVLGCGVVKQDILKNADVPDQLGWAFGIGLERIAMLLFDIPDIRLFWSKDERFLGQFRGLSGNLDGLRQFTPFSKYPVCYKDVAFWLPDSSSAAGRNTAPEFHENDVMEIVRGIAGDSVEDVQLIDQFTNQKTGKKSMCYRINYRSLERTMRNEEANELQAMIEKEMVEKLGIEIR
ncbi:hypothetical protein LZ554_006011 [Drepanopeziza brunnea f. sp. 'monogermtubi']|nr:hypothetical protein LZ554_006011 [Drepanopeziza brunnea f. sp. 'monogermtubi']